jgi:hypothetical protein
MSFFGKYCGPKRSDHIRKIEMRLSPLHPSMQRLYGVVHRVVRALHDAVRCSSAARTMRDNAAMGRVELYPFRFRDPVTGRWVRARYRAEREEIERRYAEYEIVGPPEVRDGDPDEPRFTPHRAQAADAASGMRASRSFSRTSRSRPQSIRRKSGYCSCSCGGTSPIAHGAGATRR